MHSLKIIPDHMNNSLWQTEYEKETEKLMIEGFEQRNTLFNKDYPAPYAGAINETAHARYAAICHHLANNPL